MRSTLVWSLVPLAATVASLSVTEPKKYALIDPSESFTVKWDTVSTDPSSFDIYLVNNAAYPSVEKKIAEDVDASDGSYTVKSVSGLTDGPGFQINLLSTSELNSGILAQSQQFNVTSGDSDSSSSSTTESSTSSTSSSTSSASSDAVSSTESADSTSTSATATSSSNSSSSSTPAATSGAAGNGTSEFTPGNAGVAMGAPLTVAAGLLAGAFVLNL
ncbi:Ser-Thr-rich glycosyl-phosphatidyl-inositol-anchored membrane family-domain-containing protein [Aspergillus varians]